MPNKDFSYSPSGVCSKLFNISIDSDGKVASFQAIGGCNGNLQGIAALIIGLDATVAIERLQGIRCGNKKTSCPDQIAQALKENI